MKLKKGEIEVTRYVAMGQDRSGGWRLCLNLYDTPEKAQQAVKVNGWKRANVVAVLLPVKG